MNLNEIIKKENAMLKKIIYKNLKKKDLNTGTKDHRVQTDKK